MIKNAVVFSVLSTVLFNNSECLECKIETISDISPGCTVVYGDVIVNSTLNYSFPQLSEKLSHVKQIYGRVLLMETPFENFSFLSSLESIYYKPTKDFKTSSDYQNCLRIENNNLVEELGMVKLETLKLESIPTDWQFYATYISANPKLCIPLKQTEQWLLSERVWFPPMIYCGMRILEKNANYVKYKVQNSTKIFCAAVDTKNPLTDLMPLGCQVLDIGVWVKHNHNDTELDRLSQAIQSVEIMFGSISFRNTTIKILDFKNLVTIYNMFFDDPEYYGGRGTQAILLVNNNKLTNIQFPKLENVHHFGRNPFVMISGNPILGCSDNSCNVFLKLYRFDVNDCNCGIIPSLNKGYKQTDFYIVIVEALSCAMITIGVYGNLMYFIFKSQFSVSYFQFSMLIYLSLCAVEALYVVLNNVQFHDGLDYSWFIGIQFLLVSNNENYFYQTINIIYANRISLLLSCCIYRTIAFVKFDYGKGAMCLTFFIFIFSNIWSFNGMLQKRIDDLTVQGNKWSYGIYLLNWTTLIVSLTTLLFLYFYLRHNFKNYPAMRKHQNRLSLAFLLQALLSFIFCGFPDSIFEGWFETTRNMELVRTRRIYAYYYSSTITRWHYLAYAIILRFFIRDMLSKIDIHSITVASTFRSVTTTTSRVLYS